MRMREVQKSTCAQAGCEAKATHVARHGVYRGLPLCAKHHEDGGPTPVKRTKPLSFTFREVGLLYAMVCSSLPQKEVLRRAHAQLCGTKNGWQLAEREAVPKDAGSNPWVCSDHPKTHKHYLFTC